jgi:dTDP-4-dehydrorhamnose 3,5-epimerase
MSRRFSFLETPLAGLYAVERSVIEDKRGFFSRFFCADEFKEIGLSKPIAQMNHTLTKQKGAVRGMHLQRPPHTETKVVTCIQGEVFDVAVDVRKDSPTFLRWHSEVLSSENQKSLYIPDGFAHGFQAMTDDCQLLYMHSEFYSPESEAALNVLDPRLGIEWPLEITEMSDRDRKHPMLDANYEGVDVI